MMRKSTTGAGFLIQDDYPPGSGATLGQALPTAPQTKLRLSEQISYWLSWLSFTLLVVSPVILIWMWGYVWQHNLYPFAGWRNHFEQDQNEATARILEMAWIYALFFPVGAFATSFLSLVFKPNLRAIIVLALSIVCAIVVLMHMGLMDFD